MCFDQIAIVKVGNYNLKYEIEFRIVYSTSDADKFVMFCCLNNLHVSNSL